MKLDAYSHDNSIGIDGEVHYNCDIDYLPDNWLRVEYLSAVSKKLILQNGDVLQLSKETLDKLVVSFEDAKNDRNKASLESKLAGDMMQKFYKQDDSGEWVKDYDAKMEDIKKERNRRLQEVDFIFQPDYEIAPERKEVYKQYRAALRDFPDTIDDPFEPFNWPNRP